MVFSSYQFLLIFLPITFFAFFILQKFKNAQITSLGLLIASIVFYVFWNPWDVLPLSVSILVNYGVYQYLRRFSRRLLFMWLGIMFNLIFLISYKYLNFGSWQSFNFFLNTSIPLGISFYTFTQIAFLVDCYKEDFPKNDIIRYSLFVSYFPHLVCGPILSFKQLYPQLSSPDKFKVSQENIAIFFLYFSIGIFKKILIADPLGNYVARVFDAHSAFHYKTRLWATLSYAVQLYFDFSGYSDMAVGTSRLFGVIIPFNFDSPYKSKSIIEFWRRWHISLSNFLKNYVYIPLGGNRVLPSRMYLNLVTVMILGGVWHGGYWTFVVWGAYHGLLLAINHFWRRNKVLKRLNVIPVRLSNPLKTIFTFALVCWGWVLFRSKSLDFAGDIYKSILCLGTGNIVPFNVYYSLVIGILYIVFVPDTNRIQEKLFYGNCKNGHIVATAAICGVMMCVALLGLGRVQHFIYSGF
ncbi:MAG: MBOAT family protein [Holosporales bacterium]|jgi:alginate O-acetyltransferase complex protein AlgI|nr:MBOAT family protein [Holosporales bacterium]